MSDSDEEVLAYVVDNGSHAIRWGIAGDDAPRVSLDYQVGRQPVKDGKIENWDLMESIWA